MLTLVFMFSILDIDLILSAELNRTSKLDSNLIAFLTRDNVA